MKLPPIAEKLAPAFNILEALNKHIKALTFYIDVDGTEIDVLLGDAAPSYEVDKLVESLLVATWELLPEGYGIAARDDKFVIERIGSPIEEPAEEYAGTAADLIREPVCYRLAPEARGDIGPDGAPVTSYALVYNFHLGPEMPSDAYQAAFVEHHRKILAARCGCEIKHVISISVAEYLAAGNSLE